MIKEIIEYYMVNSHYVLDQITKHFLVSLYGVLFACLFAVPLGFYIARHEKLGKWFLKAANIIQTVPALAMLSLLIIVVGMGVNTVIVAIFLYSILPILTNTVSGVNQVDENILDAAKGMGMSKFQVIFKVELPLSISVILGGIRNALVVAIGVAAVGTFIGAGGLGDIISRGLNVSDGSAIVWAGALPTALMAVIVDFSLTQLEKRLVR